MGTHYLGFLGRMFDTVTADKRVQTVNPAFKLDHFFDATIQNMESSFVLDFPKPRMLLWQSKFSDSCMIPCSSCALKNTDRGCMEEVNDLWSTFLLWRDYEYPQGSYFLLSIPVLTLVSALIYSVWARGIEIKIIRP